MRTPTSVRFVTPLAFALAFVSAAASADVVIPSTVYRRGVGNAEFRSDVRVFNPTNSPINYTPVLYDQVSGQTFTAALQTIPPRAQQSFDNIVGTLFGRALDDGSFGPIRFQTSGAIIVSSSVNNYNACGSGAVSGQWLPGLDQGQALKAGTLVQLASSVDLAAGYRTNVVFTNPGASDATVNARVRRGDGTSVSTATIGPLGPNGFKQVGNWGDFPGVSGTNDTNLWLEFTSDQPVLAFASVINNASGDPFAIVMTAEPNVSAPVPVASYTVSPASPAPGQAATFADTSTGTVANRFWAFGDGAFAANTGASTTHTYAAAGTYKSALFVGNAAGGSSATKDVAVAAAQAIAVTISATTTGNTKWTFVCQAGPCSGAGNNNVNLKVGQPYVITWTTPQSEAKTHGVVPIGFMGAPHCDDGQDLITSSHPCAVTFTPTAGMLGFPGPTYTYGCTQTQCAPSQAVHDGMQGTITIVP
ncbi:MAG: PKD domain-containing protein [Thermoanaerobaculia bacterium]|jgi:PKD repeat protein